MLSFEWNEEKAASNLRKHGVAFQDARHVFDDIYLYEFEERSMDYGEMRFNAVGFLNEWLVTVTYTERNGAIRIISARPANGIDTKNYERNRGDA